MFATADDFLITRLVNQIANVARVGAEIKAVDLNRELAVVRGINPRDETEALLAVQMGAIHSAVMDAAGRLARSDSREGQDSASTILNKCARTFATQIETLKRNRSTNEQTIRVQHLTVREGGQAIVANQLHSAGRGGVHDKKEHQPHEPDRQAQSSAPMLGHVEALKSPVPGASGARLDRLPVPRGGRRSATG